MPVLSKDSATVTDGNELLHGPRGSLEQRHVARRVALPDLLARYCFSSEEDWDRRLITDLLYNGTGEMLRSPGNSMGGPAEDEQWTQTPGNHLDNGKGNRGGTFCICALDLRRSVSAASQT